MRKILSLLTAILFAGSMMATDVAVTIHASSGNYYAKTHGWQNSIQYDQVELDENITANRIGTGNNGKYYTDWRFYTNGSDAGSFSIDAAEGYELQSVTFTYTTHNGGALYMGETQLTSQTAVAVSGQQAVFQCKNTNTNTNGQVRLTAISVTYGAAAPAPSHTYTVAGGSDVLFGTTWAPTNTANDMALVEGLYTWEKSELTLAAGNIEFKVCEDHAWKTAYPAQNYQLNIPEAGIYTVTITYNPSNNAVNAVATKTGSAVVVPTVAMHGNFLGSWADTENFEVAEGNATASLTLNLAAGNYEFGMRIGGSGNWTANGAAFTRENNSAAVVAGQGNLTLAADAAGEYTFTWTYETNTLAITFPEAGPVEPVDVTYYLKNNWENGESEWTWKAMTKVGETYKLDSVVFGLYGVNVNTVASDEGAYFVEVANFAGDAIQSKDTVSFELNPADSTITATLIGRPAAPAPSHTYTVAGGSDVLFGTTWAPANTANDMALVEGLYTWEKSELTLAAGNIEFKVCEDHAWTTAYPAQNYQLNIPEAGVYTITITYNPSDNAVNAVATKTGDAVVVPTVAMHGNFLGSWADTENFAVAEGNATASLTLNLAAGNYEFGMRIGGSGNWTANGAAFTRENNSAAVVAGQGNLTLAADAAGEYTFTWTYETNTLAITFPEAGPIEPVDVTYYLKNNWENGESEWSWKAMTKVGETYKLDSVVFGLYGVNVNTVASDEGAYFVEVANFAGDAIQSKDTVSFELNPADSTITATLIGRPSAPAVVYYLKNNWNAGADWSWLAMTKDGENWKLENVVYGGTGVNFNTVESDENATWVAQDAFLGDAVKAKDTVNFVLNPADGSITVTVVGAYVEPVDVTYYLKNNWNAGADWTWLAMTKDGENWKLENVVYGGTGVNFNTVESDENATWVAQDAFLGDAVKAKDTVNFVLNPADGSITVTVVGAYVEPITPTIENGYYLVGSMNDWTPAAEYFLEQNPENEAEYELDINLNVNDEIKVVYVENDAIVTWYPAEGDNYVIDDHHNGVTTLYFRPDYLGGDDWFAGCIYVAPTSTVGFDNVDADAKAIKQVINGKLFILRGDKTYTVDGQIVR